MATNNNNESKFKSLITLIKSRKTASILALLLIPTVTASVVFLNSSKTDMLNDGNISVSDENLGQTPSNSENNSDLEIDENAHEYIEPTKAANVSTGVSIPGWGSITLPAMESEISVDFFNPEENKDLYYLTFELRLPDDSEQGYEVLYKSGLVEPGLHIQKINLERALVKGNYNAVIHVQPYRMDENKTATNNADLKTELIVM